MTKNEYKAVCIIDKSTNTYIIHRSRVIRYTYRYIMRIYRLLTRRCYNIDPLLEHY